MEALAAQQPSIGQRRSTRNSNEKPSQSSSPARELNHVNQTGDSLPSETEHQPRPSEFSGFLQEATFVLICSVGQLLYSVLLGNIEVNQRVLIQALQIPESKSPWLIGSFLLANGVSVSISGSLVDLLPPKILIVSAFAWMTTWNIVGTFSIVPSRWPLFLAVRSMQGLALGVLVSGSISILGRLYKPGVRKTRVFSIMSSFSPVGFSIGGLQGGALVDRLGWIFASTAIVSGVCAVTAVLVIPNLQPVRTSEGLRVHSIRDFDFLGASCSIIGNTLLIFGITQGSSVDWQPYTYVLAVLGFLLLVSFYFVERRARRPLIPHQLWETRGFAALMIAFFLSYGSWLGAWQPYAVQFFLFVQHASPLRVACYFIPNAIAGVLVMWIVAYTLHRFKNQWIYSVSMLANALAPALFLPQNANSDYWALAMPGIALGTFGPDMAFAAATIFITSSVPKSYQGSAGSLLITIQNLSSAVLVAVAGIIGTRVGNIGTAEQTPSLAGIKAIWWFALGVSVVAAALTATMVRIPRAKEQDHVEEA